MPTPMSTYALMRILEAAPRRCALGPPGSGMCARTRGLDAIQRRDNSVPRLAGRPNV